MSVKLATLGKPPFDLVLYVHDVSTNCFTLFSTKSYVYFNKTWNDLPFSGVNKILSYSTKAFLIHIEVTACDWSPGLLS